MNIPETCTRREALRFGALFGGTALVAPGLLVGQECRGTRNAVNETLCVMAQQKHPDIASMTPLLHPDAEIGVRFYEQFHWAEPKRVQKWEIPYVDPCQQELRRIWLERQKCEGRAFTPMRVEGVINGTIDHVVTDTLDAIRRSLIRPPGREIINYDEELRNLLAKPQWWNNTFLGNTSFIARYGAAQTMAINKELGILPAEDRAAWERALEAEKTGSDEEEMKHVFHGREDATLTIIAGEHPNDQAPYIHNVVYGLGHNWKEALIRWNTRSPKKISGLVFTPRTAVRYRDEAERRKVKADAEKEGHMQLLGIRPEPPECRGSCSPILRLWREWLRGCGR